MIPTATPRDPNSWIVLYDRDCGFCRWSLARLLALDRHSALRPLALGTPEADALLADLTVEERESSWHLVSPAGQRWSAGAAAPPLLGLLPRGARVGAALTKVPGATAHAYRWVADHRSIFSKLIPDSAKDRADLVIERAQRRAGSAPERAANAPTSGQAASSAGSFASR